jgi:hypothetical protein
MKGSVKIPRIIRLVLFSLSLLLLLAGTALAQTSVVPAGSGTKDDPYRISELGHLVWMQQNVQNSLGKCYHLDQDIDASDTANWNDEGTGTDVLEGFYPIGGEDDNSFDGIFDGGEHKISGLTIRRSLTNRDNIGLFGEIGPYGEIRNLGLAGGSVAGHSNAGGLVGFSYGGIITNCYTTCDVTGTSGFAGGLVGWNNTYNLFGPEVYYGIVTRCYATGKIQGGSGAGGLVGGNTDGGEVSYSYADGAVDGDVYTGGLVGYNTGAITTCYATGAVTGERSVGGLVGYNVSNGTVPENKDIKFCCATGKVTGKEYVGGLVGANATAIENCYATGAVMGTSSMFVGGLAGSDNGSIKNCYSIGKVASNSPTEMAIGGLCGFSGYDITSSYWNTSTSGQKTSAGGTGKTTAQMKQKSTYEDWDFTDTWAISSSVNKGYPYMPALGDGVISTDPDDPDPDPDPDPVTPSFLSKKTRIQSGHTEAWKRKTEEIVSRDTYLFSTQIQLDASSLSGITTDTPLQINAGNIAFESNLGNAASGSLGKKDPAKGGFAKFYRTEYGANDKPCKTQTVVVSWTRKGLLTISMTGKPLPGAGGVKENILDLSGDAFENGHVTSNVDTVSVTWGETLLSNSGGLLCGGNKKVKAITGQEGKSLINWGVSGRE